MLNQAIADSIFPGAQVAVVLDGKLIASRPFGRQTYDPASPEIDIETIYDLASVTKVAARKNRFRPGCDRRCICEMGQLQRLGDFAGYDG